MWKSICKRSCIFLCCLSLFLSVFGFSANAEVSGNVPGTEVFPWVTRNDKWTLAYWRLANRATGGDVLGKNKYEDAWFNGSRSDDNMSYTYKVGRTLSSGNVKYDSFYAQLNLAGIAGKLWRTRIRSEWACKVTVTGALKSTGSALKLTGTQYSASAALVKYNSDTEDYDWDNQITAPLISGSGVSTLDMFTDNWGGFSVSYAFRNQTGVPYNMPAIRLIFDLPFSTTNFIDFQIYDVKLTFYKVGMDANQEYTSSDHSDGETVAISGFFSFLNKPLNMIINAYKKVGDWIWSKTPTSIQEGFRAFGDYCSNFWETAKNLFNLIIVAPIKASINGLWNLMPQSMKNWLSDSVDFLGEYWEYQKRAFVEFWKDPLGSITKGFSDLGSLIKSVFIPEDGFGGMIKAQWEKLSEFGEQHLGGLWQSGSIFVDLLERFTDVKVNENPTITLPQIKVAGTVLLKAQTYSFDFSKLPFIGTMHTWYLNMVDFILAGSVLTLLFKKIQGVLMN